MTTVVILLISGVLIGAGIAVIWRDTRSKGRRAFVVKRDTAPSAEPEAEITISYDRPAAAARAPIAAVAEPAPAVANGSARPLPGARQPLEQDWSTLQPTIAAGIDKVNAVLAPVRLSVGATGEPSWSYKNKGYGAYRRLLLGGESVAWLRLELSSDGRINAGVKAHKEDGAEINATADEATDGLTPARAGDLLSRCLKPAATYAARQQPDRNGNAEASELAWKSVDAVVTAALRATNGALAQAGARLVPLAPAAWEAELHRHRMTLSVEVNGDDVARMHIERHLHEMEVAVGVREAHLVDLGRRRRVPVEGITTHALAELIASCAWPAIERSRETHRPA